MRFDWKEKLRKELDRKAKLSKPITPPPFFIEREPMKISPEEFEEMLPIMRKPLPTMGELDEMVTRVKEKNKKK